jgi:chromosome segregation ATPase
MNKTPEDEAFEALERAQASLPPFKETSRHPADVQTEYNLYKAGVQDLQQKLAELEASYSIICEHSSKLETALANTKRQLDQAQKSWLTALLFRLGLMK